jgi:hypothetical protein
MTNTVDRSTFALQGNGATTLWPFTFQMEDTSEILLYLYDPETMEYTEVDEADFSVSLAENKTGSVTYPISGDPVPEGTWVCGFRVTERTQGTVYSDQQRFYAEVLQANLDQFAAQIQEIGRKADGAAYTDTPQLPLKPDPDAGRAILLTPEGEMQLGPRVDEISDVMGFLERAEAAAAILETMAWGETLPFTVTEVPLEIELPSEQYFVDNVVIGGVPQEKDVAWSQSGAMLTILNTTALGLTGWYQFRAGSASVALMAGPTFRSRAEATGANGQTGAAQVMSVIVNGYRCDYIYDEDGDALTTGDGRTWSPCGLVTPEHFGASGGDATSALEAWRDYCQGSDATAYQSRVIAYLPNAYEFSSLEFNRPISVFGIRGKSRLQGLAGSQGVIIRPQHGGTDYVASAGQVAQFYFTGVEILGPGTSDVGAGNGLSLITAESNSVRADVRTVDCSILKWPGHNLVANTFFGSYTSIRTSHRYSGLKNASLTSVTDWNFDGCEFSLSLNGDSILCSGVSEVDFKDCVSFSNAGYGLYVFAGTSAPAGTVRWSGQIDRNGIGGIGVDIRKAGYRLFVTDTTMELNSQDTPDTYSDINIIGTTVEGALSLDNVRFAAPRAASGSSYYNLRFNTGAGAAQVAGCLWGDAVVPDEAAFHTNDLSLCVASAPTAAAGTSNTQIATTEFVQRERNGLTPQMYGAVSGSTNNSRAALTALWSAAEATGPAPSSAPLPPEDGAQRSVFIPDGWFSATDGTEEERTLTLEQDSANIYGAGANSVIEGVSLSMAGRAPNVRDLTLVGESDYGIKYTAAQQNAKFADLLIRDKKVAVWFPIRDANEDGDIGEIEEYAAFGELRNSLLALNERGVVVEGNALFNISNVIVQSALKNALEATGGGTLKLDNSAFQKRNDQSQTGILLKSDVLNGPTDYVTPFEFYWSNVTAAIGMRSMRTIDLVSVAEAGIAGQLLFTLDNPDADDGAHWFERVQTVETNLDTSYPNEIIVSGTAGAYDGVTAGAYDGVWKVKTLPSSTTVTVTFMPNASTAADGRNPVGYHATLNPREETAPVFTSTASGSVALQADDVVFLGDKDIHDVNDGYIIGGHFNDNYIKHAYNITWTGSRVKNRRRVEKVRRLTIIGSMRSRFGTEDTYVEYDRDAEGVGEIGSFNPFDLDRYDEWDWDTGAVVAVGTHYEHRALCWGMRAANTASGKTEWTNNNGFTFSGIPAAYNAVYVFNDRLTLMAGGDIKTDTGNIIHLFEEGAGGRPAMDMPATFDFESRGKRLFGFDATGSEGYVTGPLRFASNGNAGNTFVFVETDAPTNGKKWDIQTQSERFAIRAINDAESTNATMFTATRVSGSNAVSLVTLANGLVNMTSTNVGIGEASPDYKLDVNGTFGFTPGSSVTPVDNGDVVFEATSNTSFKVKLKGSDGVVRSGTITLA